MTFLLKNGMTDSERYFLIVSVALIHKSILYEKPQKNFIQLENYRYLIYILSEKGCRCASDK